MEKLAFDLMAGVALQQAIDFGTGGSILGQAVESPIANLMTTLSEVDLGVLGEVGEEVFVCDFQE
jgi:hypothetical protein